jgi:hypothetical protein
MNSGAIFLFRPIALGRIGVMQPPEKFRSSIVLCHPGNLGRMFRARGGNSRGRKLLFTEGMNDERTPATRFL